MRNLLIFIIPFVFCFCSSQQNEPELENEPEFGTERIDNYPLPIGADSLKILVIGNSFTDDGVSYLDFFILDSGIDINAICLYSAMYPAATLDNWYEILKNKEPVKIHKKAGAYTMPMNYAPLEELLRLNWDVVVLQQQSKKAMDFNTFNPSLELLIKAIIELCPNKKLAFCWQMVWSDNTINHEEDWSSICNATKQQIERNGIDIIIPTGTAIENARNSYLNDDGGLTRDNHHLAFGKGRYIAAATWFQSIFHPVFGVSVLDLHNRYYLSDNEKTEINANNYYQGSDVIDYTPYQECAAEAVEDMFNITYIK